MTNLKNLTLEELTVLKSEITLRISELQQSEKKEYTFNFEYTNDTRKGVPYCAKMVIKDNKLDREFFEFSKQWGKKEVTVYGSFVAKEGDIIEQREGGSWKNDYRYFYIVENGELKEFGEARSSEDKVKVEKYLREQGE